MSTDAPPSQTADSIAIEPDPGAWRGLLRQDPPALARAFRESLGLPSDRPVVATGHQPILFHPGVLAKYLAAEAAGEALDCAVVHVVADQDTPDVTTLRRPVRTDTGTLEVKHPRLTEAPAFTALAVASQGPIQAQTLEPPFDRVSEAFARHAGETTLASQAFRATEDLLSDLIEPAPVLFASRLQSTELFRTLVDAMRADPARCCAAYNEAAASVPEAGLRGLNSRGDTHELPVWHIAPGQPRMPVYASKLDDLPPHELAPRALLFDLINRLAAADLFIHGTGGGAYAKATEQWFKAWNPLHEDVTLCPVVTVTATRTLDLGVPLVTPEDAARAVWRAHHARHTPGLLGDDEAQRRKDDLVARIDASDDPAERAGLFRDLTALLSETRTRHADTLSKLESEAESSLLRAQEHHITSDRTWPWVLYPDETIRELHSTIRNAFAPGG
ncbi:MAG: hypothetical protein ACF8Q5_08610 [Phycisphaerales bacterium JB040]